MLKKRFIYLIITSLIFANSGGYAVSAFTAESLAESEKCFCEDFESYQLLDDDYNPSYYTNNAAYSTDIINCGKPADGDYSDTSIYPYGTASVYEGNADNCNMYVYDAKGNKIYGGLTGWYGCYNGGGNQYNMWNRRLSVIKKSTNTNKTQFLNLQPINNADGTSSSAMLCRNNISLEGYSYLRANLSFDSGDSLFNKSGISVTVNPENETCEGSFDAVYFTDSTTEGMLDIYFGGNKIGQAEKSASGKWYTVEYRIYNGGASAKHRIKIIETESNTPVANTDWQDVNTDKSMFSVTNTFGIRFYANSAKNASPDMTVDDIRFENGGFTESFENYNTAKHYSTTNGVLSNGPKGNKNHSVYANGAFEGNMALNNYLVRTLDDTKTERVYGNIPLWQGYVSRVITGTNTYITDMWKDSCTIVSPADRYEVRTAGFDKALLLHPRTTSTVTEAQSVYAGMEYADITGNTTIKLSVNVYNDASGGDTLMLQLTNGRSTARDYSLTAGLSSLAYNGDSFKAYFDCLKFDSGNIYFGGESIGSYKYKTTYDVEYTTDTENSTHSVRVSQKSDNTTVAHSKKPLPADMGNFTFDGGVGFRFVCSTCDGTSVSKKVNKVLIDNVSISNKLPAASHGVPDRLSLRVNTANTIKAVSAGSYGINFEWGGDPERYLIENTTELNPLFTDRFRSGIPLARMAGVSANYMLWKDAIGDINDRSDLYFWHYDARPQYLGPVEWINMVKTADENAKFIYTVNMPRTLPDDDRILGLIGNKKNQIDTIENLKDLVRFMTLAPSDPKAVGSDGINWAQRRVDLGIADPVDIYAWELGCELDTDAQGWYRVKEYIEMCKPAIAAIRDIDPDAKISAHEKTSIFFDENITASWHKQLLNAIGSDIDYLSVHYYYQPDEWDKFKKYLDTLLSDIAQTPAKDRIKLLFTEHSSGRYTSDTSAGYGYELPHTMRGTLSTAEFLTRIMQRPEIDSAMYHSIQSSSWALMYEENGEYKKTGPGHVLSLFGEKGVGKSVECTIEGKDADISDLKVSAGAIKTDSGVNLFLVNTSNDRDTALELNMDNRYKLSKKTVITADGYESDTYEGTDEISVLSEDITETTDDTYLLGARSIVILEFTAKSRIISADITSGRIEYESDYQDTNGVRLLCAAYRDNALAGADTAMISGDSRLSANCFTIPGLAAGDTLKLFTWNGSDLCPLSVADEYILK